MKKVLCGILCLLMLLGCAPAEGHLYAVKGDNGLWGHIDEAGNWVIPPKFDDAGNFRGNYAWIQQGDREGFVNRDGEIVLLDEDVEVDSGYDSFYYGGCETGIWLLFKEMEKENDPGTEWLEGFFDVQSGVYSGLKWRGVNHRESNSRLIAVADETGKWGYVSRDTGEMVIPAKYDSNNMGSNYSDDMGSNFYDGYAVVTFWNDDYNIVQTLLLDETGKEYPLPEGINAANCDTVISGGLFEVVGANGLYGYCNTSGEVVIEPQFACTFEFEDGYAEVEFTDGTCGVIDQTGNVVMRTTDSLYANVQHGCYVLPTGEHSFTMYSVAGEELFTLQGENSGWLWPPEENGLCMYVVEKGGQRRCGWVNMQGEIISEAKWTFPDYDQPDVYFPSGLQAVYDADGTKLGGYLDESGELAIPLQFSYVSQFYYGALAYVEMKQDDGTTQYGYINQQGEWVYNWVE